jgi:hypothetical protein
MPKVNGVELGLFGESVIGEINEILATAESVCKEFWQDNHEDCPLREDGPTEGIIMCRYPERINSTRENNCTYKYCPLINRYR